jgi:hypothetical protein
MKHKRRQIKFSYQDLVNQIKRDVPVKDAKTRANKTEEISKQENCKISQACSEKKRSFVCSAKVRAVLEDHPITLSAV